MATPSAARNVLAIAPPKIRMSAVAANRSSSAILSLILAPPTIAANGLGGPRTMGSSACSSASMTGPAAAESTRASPVVLACARCAVPNASFT